MLTLTRDQVRQFDRLAIEELGIPGVVLMENAGRHAANAVLDVIEHDLQLLAHDAAVVIFCGGGNNGGDGYVIARHLNNCGVDVVAYAVKDPGELTGDAAIHAAIAVKMELVEPMTQPDQRARVADGASGWQVIVDALLGTGFTGEVRDELADVIYMVNGARKQGAKVVSIDIPSGLECDTGLASGEDGDTTITADLTVTFVAAKAGLVLEEAKPYVGEIEVVDIGAPAELIEQVVGRPIPQ
jgi:hydroxyethylthiazole kinase-like uncharacterized protein yjeF